MLGKWLKIPNTAGIPANDMKMLEQMEETIEDIDQTVRKCLQASVVSSRKNKQEYTLQFFKILHNVLCVESKFPMRYTQVDSMNFHNSLEVTVDCMQSVDNLVNNCAPIVMNFFDSLTRVGDDDGPAQINEVLNQVYLLLTTCYKLQDVFKDVHDKYQAAHTTYAKNQDLASFTALQKCISQICEELRTVQMNPTLNNTKRIMWQVMTHVEKMMPKAQGLIFS